MKKGISLLLSLVMVVFISVVTISIVLTYGLPIIEKFKEAAVIDEASDNMRVFDNVIRETASEGFGIVKKTRVTVSGGIYRVDSDTGSLDYSIDLKSDFIPSGIGNDGNMITIRGGGATASQNSTHIILENEILEVVQPKIGSETSFAAINTSAAISSIKLKDSETTVTPIETGIIINNLTQTSIGNGYSKVAFEGSNLGTAESVFHVRSNVANVEYEILYSLPASSDFLIMSVRNVSSSNQTTAVLTYKLGASSSDIIKIGDTNETSAS